METLTALSVRQPWATAILLGKDVENRSRRFHHRGPLLIHASGRADLPAFDDPRIVELGLTPDRVDLGHLIGMVEVIDCVRHSASPWADKDSWKLVLADPVRFLHPIPYRGQLAPFQVPISLVAGQLPCGVLLGRQHKLALYAHCKSRLAVLRSIAVPSKAKTAHGRPPNPL